MSDRLLFFKYRGVGIPDGFSKSFPKSQFTVDGDVIITASGQKFRFYRDRIFPVDSVKFVRIKSVNHTSTVLFACETTVQELHRTSTGTIGLHFKVKPFITFSTGQTLYAPKFVVKNASTLRKQHERLRNCTSMKRADKLKQQIIYLTKHAKAKLDDWQYKVAHRICRRFTEIHIPESVPDSKFALDYDFPGFVQKLYAVSKKYKVKISADFTHPCCKPEYNM